jgi:hypothetical protein
VRPSRLLPAAILAATATAAACGQARVAPTSTPPASTHASAPQPTVALAASAGRTTRAGSARIAMRMQMSSPAAGVGVTANASGVVAFRSRAAAISMHMTGPDGSTVTMREVMRWPVIYMRSPVFGRLTRPHRPWLAINLARIDRAQGINLNALAGTGSDDPAQMLATLEGESDSVTTVGRATVRGVPTTHYHAVIDLAKAAGAGSPALRAAVRKSLARLEAMTGTRKLPVDVWIGSDGLVRRMAYRMSVRVPNTGQSLDMALRMDMYDFGAAVHVTAPPARLTTDFSAAVAAAAGTR